MQSLLRNNKENWLNMFDIGMSVGDILKDCQVFGEET